MRHLMGSSLLDIFTYNQHFVAMMNVINAAKLDTPSTGHKHHIIPRCWFKMNELPVDNRKDNLVLLTEDDHLKVHKLAMLCSADPEMRSKQAFAVKRLLKGSFSGMHHTDTTKQIIKEKRANQIITDECKKRISNTLKGRPKPPRSKSHCEALSNALTGHVWSESVVKQRGISNRHPKYSKANYQKVGKSLSEEFHRYKDGGGVLKWQQWLHSRKEIGNGK